MPWPKAAICNMTEKKIVSAREPHHPHTDKPAPSHYNLSDFRENAKNNNKKINQQTKRILT
jgi:hypothetical protein